MAYTPHDYSRILGMQGISDTVLQNHFKLYQGYTNNTNTLLEKIEALTREDKAKTPEFAELQRRFGFEFNGMRLHEYYFENLKGDGNPDTRSALHPRLAHDFGSFDRWQQQFIGTGSMRGVGWAVLYYDIRGDRLLNVWINEHQVNHLAGQEPLLIMDVWEHAYMLDYQLDRASYIEAFFRNVNWQEVARRFERGADLQRRKAA